VELEKLQNDDGGCDNSAKFMSNIKNEISSTPVVIGGSIMDVHYRVQDDNLAVSSENK
jgi:hypothetical protein